MPGPIGGTTVLFEQLASELERLPGVGVRVINTSRRHGNRWRSISQAANVAISLIREIAACDVISFHSSRAGAAYFGPIVCAICGVFRKPWIFRGFGDFESWHRSASGLERTLFRAGALRADITFFETKSAVAYFSSRGFKGVRWYPNNRPFVTAKSNDMPSVERSLRFVFVGHVKPSKGVRELIAAGERFESIVLDVYGPLLEGMSASDFFGKKARYCGALQPQAVAGTLQNYDILLFPTYYKGEGYPGIILEAYAQGLPVIATRWHSIPEIVTEETGLLIEPQSVAELTAAMANAMASPDWFARMRAGARRAAASYASSHWTQYFAEVASELCSVR